MTPEIKERAEEIAVGEWGATLDHLPEPTQEDIVRRAIEDVRLATLRKWLTVAQTNTQPSLFSEGGRP
jgi:hypothetical protein